MIVSGAYGFPTEASVIFGSRLLGGENDAPIAAPDTLDIVAGSRVDLAADNGAGVDKDGDLDVLSITSVAGSPVVPGDSVALASGLKVTVLGGTQIKIDSVGFLRPGSIVSDRFVYEISDGRGGTSSAVASIEYHQHRLLLSDLDRSNGFRSTVATIRSVAPRSPAWGTSTAMDLTMSSWRT